MGNVRKRSCRRYRRFGVAGGKHGLKVISRERYIQKRLEDTLKSYKDGGFVSVKRSNNLKYIFTKKSVQKAKRYICRLNSERLSFSLHSVQSDENDGNRIINLEQLRKHVLDISMHSALCEKARERASVGLECVRLISERRNGLESVFSAHCQRFCKIFKFNESDKIQSEKGQLSEINIRGVWGSMVTGSGCSPLNECLGTLGVPGLRPSEFQKTEGQIGEWWRRELMVEMKEAGEEERRHAEERGSYCKGVPAISVVCDGGLHSQCSTDFCKNGKKNCVTIIDDGESDRTECEGDVLVECCDMLRDTMVDLDDVEEDQLRRGEATDVVNEDLLRDDFKSNGR
ncbi:hypothetical protein ACF0H5_019843 [Mactra antiquata]